MLISCPDCQKKISDKASACPQCGCPLDAQEPRRAKTNEEIIKESLDRHFASKKTPQCPVCGGPLHIDGFLHTIFNLSAVFGPHPVENEKIPTPSIFTLLKSNFFINGGGWVSGP